MMGFNIFNRYPKSENGGVVVENKISKEKIARFKKLGKDILDKFDQDIIIASLNPHNGNGKKDPHPEVKSLVLTADGTKEIDDTLIVPIKEAMGSDKIIPNLGSIIKGLSKKYPVWIASLGGIDFSDFDEKTVE